MYIKKLIEETIDARNARERAIENIEDAIMSWHFNHEMTHALRKSQNLAYTLASI